MFAITSIYIISCLQIFTNLSLLYKFQISCLHKSFPFRNSSLIFRSSHQKYSIEKLFSNILWYSREKVFLTCLINSLYTFKKEFRTEVDFMYHFIPTLEPNIWVLVLGTLSKSCFDPLVSWLCSSLKGLKNCSKRSGRLLASLLKATDSCLEWSLFRSIL